MLTLPLGRISGRALGALVTAVRKTPARVPLTRLFRAQLGIDALRALGQEARSSLPFSHAPLRARESHERPSLGLPLPQPAVWPRPSAGFAELYRSGALSPVTVVTRALAHARALSVRSPTLGPLCGYDDERALVAAQESAQRFTAGTARSALEGVPIAVKEEVDTLGFVTRMGSLCLRRAPASVDAVAVARLRAAGAIVIGQTPMTEFGLSPLGGNAQRHMPRNPHDPGRLPGGSSTGSAVAVATGTTPLSLGCDGGGSIRIPAALCGVFGLKPTYGRIPATGHGLPGATSVVHLGPIATSARDLALFLEHASGPDAGDPASASAPRAAPGCFSEALGRGVRGLRIGIDEDDWRGLADDIAGPGREALDALEREGALIVPIKIALARYAAPIGYLTIGVEAFAAMAEIRAHHLDELGHDMQLFLAGLETFRPDDYVDAQRIRSALREELAVALRQVDVLALPATAVTAPPVTDAEARSGFIDPPLLDAMCRFAFLANVTGVPAGVAPVGTDRLGLPVGLQIVADAWDEASVLQVLAHLERIGAARVRRPQRDGVSLDLLA
ncbi:MAG TPA: amidase [Polyangiaceae bacterium]|nr:amidase [Polyangiaceae bacterium]